jgi:hypothetical protein
VDRPLHAHTDVNVRFDDAIELLSTAPEKVLQEATDAAGNGDDEEILAALHARVAGVTFSREVVIEVDPPQHIEALRTILPLRWRAASADALFPTVDAQLEIAALSMYPPRVQLTLNGSYDPPFGGAGDVIDRVLVHRLAANVVEDFVTAVAARLEHAAEATTLTSNI